MHDTATLGLRDRKRLQTRARMEHAAVDLVIREGIHVATIEAICDAADVSPRTFFNYFENKEEAILGLPNVHLTDEIVQAHAKAARDDGIIVALVGLIVDLTNPALQATSLHKSRTEILRRYPEMFSRQIARLTRVTDELLDAVRTLLSHDARLKDALPMAEPIFALCSASVRTAVKEWIAAGSDAPLQFVHTRAVALTRNVLDSLR